MRSFCVIFCCLLSFVVDAKPVLHIYAWQNSLPMTVVKKFEHETGVRVDVSFYASNEMMYAKLKAAPDIGYDVIFPSSYYVSKMAHEGLLQTLHLSHIPNRQHIRSLLLKRQFDPQNQYSLPFVWGSTGLVYNKHYFHGSDLRSWSDLWQPRFRGQLLLLDDVREVFSVALIRLGYSINDTNALHIRQAYQLLRQLLPNVKIFRSDAMLSLYLDEDCLVGMGWSGDIAQVQRENTRVMFHLPAGRYPLWIDCVAIPQSAPHPKLALRWINFMLRPDVAAMITRETGYATGNEAAFSLLPSHYRQSPLLNPSDADLRRGELQADIGTANTIYLRYWQRLKLAMAA